MPSLLERIKKWLKAKKAKRRLIGSLLLILVLDVYLFSDIVSGERYVAADYFLPVGEGDSELLMMQSGAKVLIDGGPPGTAAADALGTILGPRDRYIDLIVLTHPQLDHYGGLIDVLKRYDVGAFISNGMTTGVAAYGDLLKTLGGNGVRQIALRYGDSIASGGDRISVLSPDAPMVAAGVLNDAAMVLEAETGGMRTILTSDIGTNVEDMILPRFQETANVLKVAHHGSKYSSSPEFLNALEPQVAVIEVGKNTYGHPASETLKRLADVGAAVFRTGTDGLIKISSIGGMLVVSKVGL